MALVVQQQQLDDTKGFFDDENVQFHLNPVAQNAAAGSAGLNCDNGHFWHYPFSSANNSSRSNDAVVQPSLEDNIILLTLPKADHDHPRTSPSLTDLLTQTGYGATHKAEVNLFNKILGRLPIDKLTLTVDDSDVRNCMWLSSPGDTVQLATALTFTPDSKADAPIPLDAIIQDIARDTNFSALSDLTVTFPSVLIQRVRTGTKTITTKQNPDGSSSQVITWQPATATFTITLEFLIGPFIFWIVFHSEDGMQVSVTYNNIDDPLHTSMFNFWNKLNNQRLPGLTTNLIKPTAAFTSDVQFLRYEVQSNGKWQATVAIDIKQISGDVSAVDIYQTYDSEAKELTGGLILEDFYKTTEDHLLLDYRPEYDLDLPPGKTDLAFWDLKKLFPDSASFPKNLPTAIITATASFHMADPEKFTFSGKAINPPQPETDTSPLPSPFVWKDLDVSFTKSPGEFECSLATTFVLKAPGYTDAELGLEFDYSSKGWLLKGNVDNLSCGLLYSFFDGDCKDALLDTLGKLQLTSLKLLYTFDSAGSSANFLFTGVINLGELQLRLFYQYTSSRTSPNEAIADELKGGSDPSKKGPKPLDAPAPPPNSTDAPRTSWIFECDLGSSSGDATIGSIANSIIPDAASNLPSFVASIKIPQADGTTDRTPVYLRATKNADGKVLFAFKFTLSFFSFTFVSVSYKVNNQVVTKRLLRFEVDKLPIKDNIPLLDRLPQPFDKLEYVWVNHTTSGGFTKADIDAVNDERTGVLSTDDALLFKAAVSTEASKDQPTSAARPKVNADPVVLTAGNHFMVINDGKVAVDHLFFASPAPASTPAPRVRNARALQVREVAAPAGAEPVESSPPAKGSVSFKLGPLSVDGVSLQFKEKPDHSQALCIKLDATFELGPITFTLLGFGLEVTLSKDLSLDHLQNAIADVGVTLEGLAFAFNKPPLLIAGGFQHEVIPGQLDMYLGGISVSFPPYTFVGIGEYATVELPANSGKTYKSVFLFAKLDGPLITLEFATISGVRLGFGYNSFVRSPTIEELTDFPFITDHSLEGTGNDPMKMLKALVTTKDDNTPAWVSPRQDSYWFAAGMSITAFDILTVTVVAMLSFRDSGLVASIFADAVAMMPPNAPKEAVIVYAEIAMMAEMNFVDGYFRVEAALAPTSYLLVPACKIYGGFALCYWFPPSEHAGDFVFSIGGYHRSYSPPPWYPVPKRLGVSFNVDIVSVTGESYFAITPKCAMGGAMIHASLAFGPISAWLDATFDALVQFHPLHYTADFSVSIGVTFDADILFIHIHISCSVGAQLHIEGPEFGGHAHVDFYLFAFDVDFGASPQRPPPLDLYQFWNMLHKAGPENGSGVTTQAHDSPLQSFLKFNFVSHDDDGNSISSPQTIPGAAFKYILEDGNFTMPKKPDSAASANTSPSSTGAGEEWFVKGGTFQFRIASDFAIKDATIALSDDSITQLKADAKAKNLPDPVAPFVRKVDPSKHDIFSKSMHRSTAILSTLAVTVARVVRTVDSVTGTTTETREMIDHWDEATLVEKDVPTALWDPYDASQDPANRPQSLLNGDNATTKQCMSLLLKAPPPILCPPSNAPGFIPKFKATAASRLEIRDFGTDKDNGTAWIMQPSEPTQTKYLPQALTATELAQTNAQRWKGIQDTWKGLSSKNTIVNDAKDGLLSLCATNLGWDVKRPQTEDPSKKLWQLKGGIPSKLIGTLDGKYLDLPRVGVVAA